MGQFLLLITGLVGLWIGTEFIIRGAVRLSARYRLSETVIGLSLLAMGSDLPEIVVMADASLKSLAGVDKSGIVIGSAIGSAIGQFGLAMGVAGLVGYLVMSKTELIRHGAVLIGSVILLFILGFDGVITRIEGGVLLLFFAAFFLTLFAEPVPSLEEIKPRPKEPVYRSWGFLILGFVLLLGNAELTVSAATAVAERIGISETAISLVVIGMGSSLPELSLSVNALLKKKGGLSVGNLVGSNVLDTLLIPGAGAVISPLLLETEMVAFDLPFLLLLTVLVIVFFIFPRRGLQRGEALVLIGLYAVFVVSRLAGEAFNIFPGSP